MPDVINKVMSLIGKDDPGSDKDLLLKQLAKEISQNKYAKFYRIRQGEADIPLGQYFYSLYKTVYPLKVFLKDPAKGAKIRQITLEAFLDKHVMDIIRRLSPEAIAERKKTAGTDISNQLKEDLASLATGFDSPRIATADKCHNLIISMKQFAGFDFYSFLQKFDSELKDGDFISQPKFVPVDANVLAQEILTFFSVLPPLEANDGWKTVFEILKYCKGGTEVIPLAHWNNMLVSLQDLKQSKILELICRMATANPILEMKSAVPSNEALSAVWLAQKTNEVREVITGITGSQKQAQLTALEQAVFGPLPTTRLTYYTADRGRILLDKELEGYVYAPALNHLLAFIQEYMSKEIQELCDILLVRGQWTNNTASRQMSEGFHDVLDITPGILQLDENLSDEGSNGLRVKGALLRVDRDKSQARLINNVVGEVNEEALNLLNRVVPPLIVVGKHFKMLLDDCERKHFELIMNWKELAGMSTAPLSQRISTIYKKINYFVQLMLLETRQEEE